MKKLFFFLLLAVPFFAGCSETEVLSGESSAVLSFDTHIGKSSRALAVSRFEEGDTIGVYMYHAPTDWATNGIGGSSVLMENVVLRLDAGAWIYNPTLFWKQNEKYTFFAYAPYKEKAIVTNGVLSYTVGADETKQEDLLYSVPSVQTKDRSWNGSVALPDKVQFVFTHALSQVKFSVATEYDYSSLYTIELTDIKLDNIYNSGSLNLVAESSTVEPWSNLTTLGSIDYSPTKLTLGLDLQTITNATGDVWMLLPQTLPADAEVEFTAHLTKVGTQGTATDGDYTLRAPLTAATWEHNKVYNYQLTLNMDQILGVRPIVIGDPVVIEWEETPPQELQPVVPTVKVNIPDANTGSTDTEFSLTKASVSGLSSQVELQTGDNWIASVEGAATRAATWLMLADDAQGTNASSSKTGTGNASFYVYTAERNSSGTDRSGDIIVTSRQNPASKLRIRVTQKGIVQVNKMTGWAGCNVYFDGTKLTFDDAGVTAHQKYHGVLFQWGSLVAISPVGAYDATSSIIYTPTEKKTFTWAEIPNGGSTVPVPATHTGEADEAFLLEIHDPAAGVGDICKYITDMGWAPGADNVPRKQWRLPTGTEMKQFENPTMEGASITSWRGISDKWGRENVNIGHSKLGAYIPDAVIRASIINQEATPGALILGNQMQVTTYPSASSYGGKAGVLLVGRAFPSSSSAGSQLVSYSSYYCDYNGPVRCVTSE